MSAYTIRVYGDPVLNSPAAEVTEIDKKLAKLVTDMFTTMYDAPGLGLAAPQVGVRKRLFVYDVGDGPGVIINPEVVESDGEWTFDEGCLSVPGLSWEIVRPNQVHLVGVDMSGNEISIEAEELFGRLIQHEMDHLDGVLLMDRLDPDTRKEALATLRDMTLIPPGSAAEDAGLRLS
jgi:peptide deformylase